MMELTAPQEPAQPAIVKTGDPAKLTYLAGEVFDLTGFSAKVVAADGTETPVPADKISVDKTGALMTSDTTVTVTVAPDGLTPVTYPYTITVTTPATTIATGTSTVFSVSAPAPKLTVGDTFTMTATVTVTGGGAYGFTGGFAVVDDSYNPVTYLQVDAGKFAADNPGITLDTTTVPGYLMVYVESDGKTLKIPEGDTKIKFTFTVVNTAPSATMILGLNSGGSWVDRWALLTDPSVRIAQTGTGLKTINFNSTKLIDMMHAGLILCSEDAKSAPSLFGLTIAYTANVGFTLDKASAAVGDTVTATATINSAVDAYGFTGALQYPGANLQLDIAATKDANPALKDYLTITNTNGANGITCSGTGGKIITAGTPLALVLKFKVTNTTTGNLTVNFGGYPNRLLLFKNNSVQASDVDTAAKIATQEAGGTIAIAPSTASPALTTLKAATVTLSAVGPDSGKVGETITVKATITSTVDAYGFTGAFSYPYNEWSTPPSLLVPDVDATVAANPGLSGLTVETSSDYSAGYVRFTYNPAPAETPTKVITSSTPLELILKFKVVATAAATTTNIPINVGTSSNQLVLFTDSTLKYADLYNIDATTFNNNINAAETACKAAIAPLSGSALNLHTAFFASVAFDTAAGKVGGGEVPVTITATITAPTDKDVYGFETGIMYPHSKDNAIQLNRAATIAANTGVLEGKVQVGNFPTYNSSSYTVPIWVESDGTNPIIKKGETLALKLVFSIPAGSSVATCTVNTGTNFNRMLLFTDPSIRAKATGDGLTAINFTNNTIVVQEALGTIAVAGSTAGSIKLEKSLTDLSMNSDGYYLLATPTDVLAFANAVNTLGYTAIKATVKNDIDLTGSAFAGIGTAEHPFTGTIQGNKKIKIARVVADGGSAVGGLVNYLGTGGTLNSVSTEGTITGTFGGASIGGLVGVSTGGNVYVPYESVAITGTATDGASIGGIYGTADYYIGQSTYTGNIIVTSTEGTVNVGGIEGTFDGTGKPDANRQIYQCYNTGNISGGTNTGSIIGSITYGIIQQSGNNGGAVTGSGNTGGVAGKATGTAFANVCNKGAVNGSGDATGGIVGYVYGAGTGVSQSYNTAAVTSSGASVGGIIGENAATSMSATSNFNLGNVMATGSQPNIGAVIGKATVTPAVYKGNYYLKNSSVNTFLGDALDDAEFTVESGNESAKCASNPASFILTGANGHVPGIYSYLSAPPVQDGDGYYLLSTVDDVLWFATTVQSNPMFGTQNQINGRLTNDIDMSKVSSEQFLGIGGTTEYGVYAGTFDGAGHTVTLKTGPFFNNCVGATIKNLTVEGSISGSAGIVNSISKGTIDNCHNKANITTTSDAGGIAGNAQQTVITNCTNSGNITCGQGGGIVGTIGGFEMMPNSGSQVKSTFSRIENCANSGNITGSRNVGGIAGETSGGGCTASFINCTNTGNITSTAQTSSGQTGYNPVYVNSAGGILGGAIDIAIVIDGCKNEGDVTGTANNIGGIVGVVSGSQGAMGTPDITVTNSANSGDLINTVAPDYQDHVSYDGQDHVFSFNPNNISVGGIVGNIMTARTTNISGNSNTGNVSSALDGAHLSGVVASGGTRAGIVNNKTGTFFGLDKDNQNITLAEETAPVTPSVTPPVTSSGHSSAYFVKNPIVLDTPAVTTPLVETPAAETPAAEAPAVLAPAATAPDNTDIALGPAPLETSTAAKNADTPLLAQNDSKTPEQTPAEPGKAAESSLKEATIYAVVQEAIQNPVIVRGVLLVAFILAGLGGLRRYRKSRRA
ncbi:MAG TPA: hypothetical protein VN426_13765 [Syntrophomonadaceae bacterium]|nr:hypothetical protein [Syntrophomonadaceae bacterium]